MLLEDIILKNVAHVKNNRSISAIYYILVGKRSVQTVQDAYIYQVDQFYGILRTLKRQDFEKIINQLAEHNFLIEETPKTYVLSELGLKRLEQNKDRWPLYYFNGSQYNESDFTFYHRLLLLIQVLTNKKMQHTTYIPVIDQQDIVNWVVKVYPLLKNNTTKSLQSIYEELSHLLSSFSDREAGIFVYRLTGYKAYGKSLKQLAKHYEMNNEDIQLLLTGIIHQMITLIITHKNDYRFLSRLIEDLSLTRFISKSAFKTKTLLNEGYNLVAISKVRNLRMNTIYDHIVEIALADTNFNMAPFVTPLEKEEIISAYKKTNSTRLKVLKNNVSDNISYFQIRLVIATSQRRGMEHVR